MTQSYSKKDLRSLLTRIGLSDDEISILLSLYQFPNLTAGRLAQLTGLKRGNVYNQLSLLSVKNLVIESTMRGVKRFIAAPPKQICFLLEKRAKDTSKVLEDAYRAIPFIESLIPLSAHMPKISLFQGEEQLKELYESTLKTKDKCICAFGDFAALFPKKKSLEMNRWLWRYSTRRAKKGILYRGLLTRSNDSDIAFRKRKAQKRVLKVLPQGSLSIEVNIFDDKVAICSTANEMMGVLIESGEVAKGIRLIFETLWAVSEDYSLESEPGRKRRLSL